MTEQELMEENKIIFSKINYHLNAIKDDVRQLERGRDYFSPKGQFLFDILADAEPYFSTITTRLYREIYCLENEANQND
jgi:hypothetical protein